MWHAAAIVEAAAAKVPVEFVMGRQKRLPVSMARWRAWRRLFDMGYGCSAIGRQKKNATQVERLADFTSLVEEMA